MSIGGPRTRKQILAEADRREAEARAQERYAAALRSAVADFSCSHCEYALIIPRRTRSGSPLPEATQVLHALDCTAP